MSWRTWHRSAVVLLCSLRDLAHETVDGARDVKAQKHRKNVPLTRVGGRDRRPALYSWCFAKQTLAQVKQNPFKSHSYARQGYRVRFTVYSLRYTIQISDNTMKQCVAVHCHDCTRKILKNSSAKTEEKAIINSVWFAAILSPRPFVVWQECVSNYSHATI